MGLAPNGIADDDDVIDESFLKEPFGAQPLLVSPFANPLLGVTLRLQFFLFVHGERGPPPSPSTVTVSCSTLPMATPAILIGTLLSPVLSFTLSWVWVGGAGGSDPPRNSRSFIADDFLRAELLSCLDRSADRRRMMLNRPNTNAAQKKRRPRPRPPSVSPSDVRVRLFLSDEVPEVG